MWISTIPHYLNGTELSCEEFWDNVHLRYGLMPQDIPAICNGCGKKFLIEHGISCPKLRLVVVGHDCAAKEWGALGYWDLTCSDISYRPKSNSRTVQGLRTGAGARWQGETATGGTGIVGEARGGHRNEGARN